jgi:hypothetical protein
MAQIEGGPASEPECNAERLDIEMPPRGAHVLKKAGVAGAAPPSDKSPGGPMLPAVSGGTLTASSSLTNFVRAGLHVLKKDSKTGAATPSSQGETLSMLRLEEVRRSTRRRRCQVTGTCVFLGIALVTPGLILFNTHSSDSSSKGTALRVLGDLMAVTGKSFLAAASLPQDTLLVRCLGLYHVAQKIYMLTDHAIKFGKAIECSQGVENGWVACADDFAIECLSVVLYSILTVAYLATFCAPGRKACDSLWRLMGWTMFCWALQDTLRIITGSMPIWADGEGNDSHPIWEPILYILVEIVLGVIFLSPGTRERAQAVLSRRGHEVNVASLIAGFLGGSADEEGVLKDSKRFFRFIYLSDLTFEDMLGATSGTRSQDVFLRSQPAHLGEIDAFVSHSWHDDARAKWDILEAWCKNFSKKHGRQPKLWLDFCCIDQNNIEASLRCLPVYLSGCRALLVVAGSTYVRRLWCAIELFVFVSIHGISKGYEGVPLELRVLGQTAEERSCVRETFTNFDANDCQCFDPEDKERLLGIVEAGSGTMDRFNMQIRGMMGRLQEIGVGREYSWSMSLRASRSVQSGQKQETVQQQETV